MVRTPNLPPRLRREAQRAEDAARAAGLDFFEVVFESVDARDLNAIAAYGGFPRRYASWRFGMDFERLHKGYSYGLSKIYELVINNDPTIAYLVRSNSLMEQKLVMAHVFGHADFFKNNAWFAPTERRMVQTMDAHADRLKRISAQQGQDQVERLLDRALGLEGLIDPYLPLQQARSGKSVDRVGRARASFEAVMDGRPAPSPVPTPIPGSTLPTYDCLAFLIEFAPLEPWERDVLCIVRDEAYYFMPQRQTKIMNEGWASFWHSRLLTNGLLEGSEIIDFADCHSGATASQPGQLNPYKLGIELFRHAERLGHDIFRLRKIHNDSSFIDELVDEEFAHENQLFTYHDNPKGGGPQIASRDWRTVKQELMNSLAWGGQPRIQLREVDAEGALVLVHRHDGRDLVLQEAGQLISQLAHLWGAPVHLLSLDGGQGKRVTAGKAGVSVADCEEAIESCGGATSPKQRPEQKRRTA
ncbi:MAG: SpoVR family protein [Planctomycetota bacterium]|nr:SpoVR family protein [Planctomycetota bacterium]